MTGLLTLREVLPEDMAERVRALGENHGVRNIRVFGSFARGEARSHSDLDLLVEYVPGHGGFAFVEFWRRWRPFFGRRVDVVTDKSLHPLIRDRVLAEAVPL